MPPKNKRQPAATKVHKKKAGETQIKDGLFLVDQGLQTQESTSIHNLTEPLLEVIKEEPLVVSPTTTLQPLNEVMLEPKQELTNPTGVDPIPEVPLFCFLCLRPCSSGQVVEFSAEPSWNCLDVASGRDKLSLLYGLELELEQSAICRPCWTMVETLADFREGCLKASAWRASFSFGLDEAGDDWLSKENVEAMERTRKLVQKHVERIEMAEVEAQNSQVSGMDEISEEKPMLEDGQGWIDDVQDPDSSEDSPKNDSSNETEQVVEKLEIKAFSCAKCQRTFETKSGMAIHYEYCKKPAKEKPLGPKLHTCSICSADFTHKYRLEEHLNRHFGNKPYVCRKGNCNKPLYGFGERRKHERKCKGNNSYPSVEQDSSEMLDEDISATIQQQNEITIYSCNNCKRKFHTKGGLKKHGSSCNVPVEGSQFHTCKICSMDFLNAHNLDAHMNKHNGIKPYKCKNESCGKHFYGKFELYRHNGDCGKDKPICSLCGLQLNSKQTLKNHMDTHAEEPGAECATCGRKFKSKKSLKRHQAVHSDERNYPCSECGKAFKSSHALNVHRRIHTQEKPYSCAVCGQGFAYKCLIKPHMEKCHAGEG